MGQFTPAGLKAINDAALGSTALPLFASWHTADPGATGTSEYTAVGITRVASGTLTSTSDADSADLTNAAAITSPAATGATSAMTHVGLWTALTGGIFVGSHLLTTAVTLALGEKIRIPAGDLDLSFPIA